jgi:hypothetical protein
MDQPFPEAYLEASREISRLFDAGELTVSNFEPLLAAACAAINGHPHEDDLLEGILLYDPSGIPDDGSELVPLGGAETA